MNKEKVMNGTICAGSLHGGEIEPGTFHVRVTRDPGDEDLDPSTSESDGPDAADPDEARDR